MSNILILEHDDTIFNILSPYFIKLINSYIKRYSPLYLGMILHKDQNYFTINLKQEYKNYSNYTPLILFKREFTKEKSFLYEDDHYIPYSSKRIEKELWEKANKDIHEKYPYIVHTIGCDDGDKGWVFETEKAAFSFIDELKNTTNSFPENFKSYWDFLEYFDKNQRWSN